MPRLTGRYALLEQLAVQGVKHVFGNPGTTEQAFMDALQDYPQIEYVLALHESVAVGIADGYARASGRPAFVQLHITPGLGNAIGMLYNSFRSHTPLVIYAGQHPQHGAPQEPILAGDLVRLAEPFTKWAAEAQDAADIPMLVRRAFKVALDPPPGPVFLSIPANLMDEEADVEIAPAPHVYNRVRPDQEALQRLTDALLQAQSPIIICGDGVATAGAQEQLVQLAETIGARIHATFCAELPLPSDHPLYAGLLNVIAAPMLRAQLQSADLILIVGTPVLPLLFPLKDSPFPESATVVHIDLDPWEIGKNWPPRFGLLADPKAALTELLQLLHTRITPEYREAAQRRAQAAQTAAQTFFQTLDAASRPRWESRPIAPGRMTKEIADALLPSTIVFDEAVTASGYAMRHLRSSEPTTRFRATGGSLGQGMAAPIGIKLARPERPVLSLVGDGSALYTIQALWSAAHHRIPVTWVIANNRSYRILKLNMLDYLGESGPGRRFLGMDLNDPPLDFATIAAGFGVRGVRVEHPSDIGEAVREAQASEEPRLVDVIIDGDISSRWL